MDPEGELTAGESVVRVAICIATYRRPRMLAALLGSLAGLRPPPSAEVRVIVVDNDETGSALTVVDEARATLPWPLSYLLEPTRNISLARNAAVAEALRDGADHVAFVDDDEVVSPGWLASLLDTLRIHGADAVCGPVLPKYDPRTERWVIEGGFFEPRRFPTGTALDFGMTCNALVSARLLDPAVGRFDPGFGTSGGGDAHFFMRAHHAGAKLVWSDEAVVEEEIPLSRAHAPWILRRAYRVGNASVRCRRALLPLGRWLVPAAAGALARVAVGTLLLPVALVRGRAARVRALRTAMHGFGAIGAMVGKTYEEYQSVHGS